MELWWPWLDEAKEMAEEGLDDLKDNGDEKEILFENENIAEGL